jgi:hypothetical protein
VIEHQFACDSCGGTRKYRENLKTGEPSPPTKLAHARDRLATAA